VRYAVSARASALSPGASFSAVVEAAAGSRDGDGDDNDAAPAAAATTMLRVSSLRAAGPLPPLADSSSSMDG